MTKKEKEVNPNIYTQKKLLSFPTKVNNNNNSKKTKHFECNRWVCKILDSSVTTANEKTTSSTTTQQYEPYNIVSDTGDSIFSPMHERYHEYDADHRSIINTGQVFLSADLVKDSFFQQQNFKK
jgi:hypothetical protein